jgi:cell division protease FtsH
LVGLVLLFCGLGAISFWRQWRAPLVTWLATITAILDIDLVKVVGIANKAHLTRLRLLVYNLQISKNILMEHKEGHNALAELLIKKEVIMAEDVEHIFGKRPWLSRSQEIMEDEQPKIDDDAVKELPEVQAAIKEHEENQKKNADSDETSKKDEGSEENKNE